MKEFELLVDGHYFHVEVEDNRGGNGAGPLALRINGRPCETQPPAKIGPNSAFSIVLNGREYKIELAKPNGKTYSCKVDGRACQVVVKARPRPSIEAPTAHLKPQRRRTEEGGVAAPMPGRVVALRVKEGDRVEVGDTLLILEAMKMENVILVPKDGVVKELRAREGATVDKGEILALIQ